jgi:BirA family biotin operon repressor/biotin-[acetyl-CoA-carboxylase] ligase
MPHPAETETILLREFLAAGDGCVSGAHLAKVVGLSRVAVWGHLHRLEAEGFAFEPVHSRGYRLTARPSALNATLIRALLPPGTPPLRYLPSVDSTNEEACRQLAAGAPRRSSPSPPSRPAAAAASAAPGTAPPTRAISTSPQLSVPISRPIGLLSSLSDRTQPLRTSRHRDRRRAQLKWPNDLHFGPRKVAGMLTETRGDADQTPSSSSASAST